MAEFKKKIMSLINGIQSKLSPDKADGFKTLTDVDQDEKIGGITARKGISMIAPDSVTGTDATIHAGAGYSTVSHYPEQAITQVWDNKKCLVKVFDTGMGSPPFSIGQTVSDKSFIMATPYRDDNGIVQDNGAGTKNKQQITQDASRDPFGVCCLQRDSSTFMCMLTNLMRGKNKDNQGIYIYNGNPAENGGYAYAIDNPICTMTGLKYPSFVATDKVDTATEYSYPAPINFYIARWVFEDGTESYVKEITSTSSIGVNGLVAIYNPSFLGFGIDAYAPTTIGGTFGYYNGTVSVRITRRNNEATSLKRVAKIKLYRLSIKATIDGNGKTNYTPYTLAEIYTSKYKDLKKLFNKYSWQLIATLEGDQLDNRDLGDPVDSNYVLYDDTDRFLLTNGTTVGQPINHTIVTDYGFELMRWNASFESVMIGDNDLYVPTPTWMFDYNGRVFAVGDYAYKNTLFFTKDWDTDFLSDNSTILPIPIGDKMLTCGTEHGASAYVFSESSTTRVTETSTELPYYKVESVEGMTGIGCVSPKTLVKIFGRLFFLSKQGMIMFDGSSYQVISNDIDDIIKDNVAFKYVNESGNEVTDVDTQPCFYIPYHADAIYSNADRAIYLAIPTTESVYQPVYRIFKYNIRLSKWSEVILPNFRSFVREQGIAENIKYLGEDGYIRVVGNGTQLDSYSPQVSGIPINSVVESHDIDLGTESIVKYITLVGEGLVNIEIFTRKEATTPDVTLNDYTLTTEDTDIPLNLSCRFVRTKFTVVNSSTFKLTQEPILTCYTNGKVGRQ